MPIDVSDLRSTIIPKSDQLNAEQLLGGPIVITVTDVRIGSSAEQPVTVHYEGENGRPFKPCKTMRKVLIFAWGPDGREWIGRSMRLYNDPQVKFGGDEVGGIRISHMTDIERDVQVSLTATRGKKAVHRIERLSVSRTPNAADITASPTIEALKERFGAAYKGTKDAALRANLKSAYDARLAALTPKPFDENAFAAKLTACTDVTVLDLQADEIRDVVDEAARERLAEVYRTRRAALG